MKCMAEIVPNDNFEVVNALDEVVWPVPRGFKVTKALAAKLDSKAGASFTLHLPLKIQRGLFK